MLHFLLDVAIGYGIFMVFILSIVALLVFFWKTIKNF